MLFIAALIFGIIFFLLERSKWWKHRFGRTPENFSVLRQPSDNSSVDLPIPQHRYQSPKFFKTPESLKWIPLMYFLIILLAASPFIVAFSAGALGERIGCVINEGGGDVRTKCEIFNSMFSLLWLGLMTIPLGTLLIILLTIYAIHDRKFHLARKPPAADR